jgi:hypothetical protein
MIYQVDHGQYRLAAWHLQVSAKPDGKMLTFLIVHWPSKMQETIQAPLRVKLASRVANTMDEAVKAGLPNIVVMGDFNVEPFEDPLRECLEGARDRGLFRKRKRNQPRCYNPFWRFLTDGQGTYYYASCSFAELLVFDQIIVSRALVAPAASDWRLEDAAVGVWRKDPLADNTYIGKSGAPLDHYPVVAAIVRTNSERNDG